MKKALILLSIFVFLFSTNISYAAIGLPANQQGPDRGAQVLRADAGANLSTLISNTIGLFFTIGGIGFIIMILWGAVNWILSGGDKEKIAAARKRITTAIIGIVVLSLTFVVALVIGQLTGVSDLMDGSFQIKGLLTP